MALAKQFLNMGKLHRSALWKHLCLETSLSVFGVYLIGRETITTSVTFKVTLIITVTATSDGSVTEIQKANSSQRAMDYIQTQLSCIFLVKKMLKKKKNANPGTYLHGVRGIVTHQYQISIMATNKKAGRTVKTDKTYKHRCLCWRPCTSANKAATSASTKHLECNLKPGEKSGA